MRLFRFVFAILIAFGLSIPGYAAEQETAIVAELNKLETTDDGLCRAYFLFRNNGGASVAELDMSLAVLNSSGVIDDLLSIAAGPLPADRTTLKLFDVAQSSCNRIGQILVHDISACGGEENCFDIISLSSLAAVPLVK